MTKIKLQSQDRNHASIKYTTQLSTKTKVLIQFLWKTKLTVAKIEQGQGSLLTQVLSQPQKKC